MKTDAILAECIARKKVEPTKTPAQIVDSVMNEIAAYKTAIRERPEFKEPAAPAKEK